MGLRFAIEKERDGRPRLVVLDELLDRDEWALADPGGELLGELTRLAEQLVTSALASRAEGLALSPTDQDVAVVYKIDGVMVTAAKLDRYVGLALMRVLKALGGASMFRRPEQFGLFWVEDRGKVYTVVLDAWQQKADEHLLLLFDDDSPPPYLTEAGMGAEMVAALGEIATRPGLLLVSGWAKDDRSKMFRSVCRTVEYRSETVVIKNASEPDDVGGTIATYDEAKGVTAAWLLRCMASFDPRPNMFLIRQMTDAAMIDILSEEVTKGCTAIVGMEADNAADALLRVLAMSCDRGKFARAVTASLSFRWARQLCSRCKQGYDAPPDMLRSLGARPGASLRLWERGLPSATGACPNCNGIGYRGRTALFELLVMTDKLRHALLHTPNPAGLAKLAREGGHWDLEMHGIELVFRGLTSYEEVVRVIPLQLGGPRKGAGP